VWSTVVIISNGGAEANPIVLYFMNATSNALFGLIFFKAYVIVLSGIIVNFYKDNLYTACSLAIVSVGMASAMITINLPMVLYIYGGV